ncbi:MAG: class I SAM-dependent methyltransferase [Clostridia bacterium]|nr:class I SAM-dependent methyltransferase [Clostridia bacterium]
MKTAHEILLYIAYNLSNQNQHITVDTVLTNLEWIRHEKFDIDKEMAWLVDNGFLAAKDKRSFLLTEAGQNEAFQINEEKRREDFNQFMDRATDSAAYLDYCEEVYGYRMYLFNMMDKAQLDHLFHSIRFDSTDTVMDIGCGTGSILNQLTGRYHCRGVGIDQLKTKIVRKYNKTIEYLEGNIDTLADYRLAPSTILSVDSLYFSCDLEQLISTLKETKSRLYLYYSQYIFDEKQKDRTALQKEHTRLAEILQKNSMSYSAIEYSRNEYGLYENTLRVLPKFQSYFEREGNLEIYTMKMNDARGGQALYDKGLASRYLYIVE